MQSRLVLTLIGKDRPGLVEALAATVAEHGGNWVESRMCRLGGEFAGVLRVEISETDAEGRYRFDVPGRLEWVSFIDWGTGKNHDDALDTGRDTIVGAGVGLQYRRGGFNAELYWAHAFDDFDTQDYDLQDDGIHLTMDGARILESKMADRINRAIAVF